MKNFYVYAYLNPQKPGVYEYDRRYKFDYEPFYVGKGKNKRAYTFNLHNHGYMNNKIKSLIKKGFMPIVIFLKKNITEEESFKQEIKAISTIGRKDLKEGPLWNLSNGGDGSSGHITSEETKKKIRRTIKEGYKKNGTRKHKEITKKKISKTLKGVPKKPFSKEHIEKLKEARKHVKKRQKGEFHHTEETKRKISNAGMGRVVSEETRKKKSMIMKGIIFSKEHKQKISKAKKGKPMSKKNREALKKYWKSKKGKCFFNQHTKIPGTTEENDFEKQKGE
jgi:hypothetical protein